MHFNHSLHYIMLILGLFQTMCPVFRSRGGVCSAGISTLSFNRIIMIQYWSCNAKIYSQIRFFLSRRWWEDWRTGQWSYRREFALVWSSNLCGAVEHTLWSIFEYEMYQSIPSTSPKFSAHHVTVHSASIQILHKDFFWLSFFIFMMLFKMQVSWFWLA